MYSLRKLTEDDDKTIFDMLQHIESDENGFHNYVTGMPYEYFPFWLKENVGFSKGIGLKAGWVPQTTYWLYHDNVPVGIGRIRHYLNDNLRVDGGHVGYAISGPHRGKGHGNVLLKLLLEECRHMGIEAVHIGANKDNERSNKIILHNGGALCREIDSKNYYIIDNR